MTCLFPYLFSSPPEGGRVIRRRSKLLRLRSYARRRAAAFQGKAMTPTFPPTVIVRHSHENPRKCSILPLKGRPDLLFLNHPVKERPPLVGYVPLAAEGPEWSVPHAA